MEYVKSIVIKFALVFIVFWLVPGMVYGLPLGQLFILSIAVTGVSYIVGDLLILPRFENWGAIIADFLLAFTAVWFYGTYFANHPFSVISAAGITGLIMAVGEGFFHRYMDSHILHVDERTGGRREPMDTKHLQTEFGAENNPVDREEKD